MPFNWSKFVSLHSTIVVLFIFNLIILFSFTLFYYLCEKYLINSFYCPDNSNYVCLIDYFLLSVSIQSGVGTGSISPSNNISKLLVAAQQFFVMTSSVIILYVFIFFTK